MKDRSVLVIDDEKDLRDLLSRALPRRGFRVRTAVDGLEGLEAALREEHDAVISDVMMPGLDGFQVLEGLKRMKPGAAVILATGFPSAEGARRAAALGAFAYLAKPYDLSALFALLDGAVALKASPREDVRDARRTR